ncbi:MSMEG_0568 family radical SAM protein [Microbacterium paludicola]|uniref:MSMEG_0568 family radical SAM protein n=1 Tax=Microbacterium paludicola TaxID=300019 RepID=A0A4Y9FXX3_9MICO|nr:MSMEG_0568 family radical SAM protein [Microbacterium paludicola]MBF0815292.1 MSMEG_0568 family radical SAM protein [Microbacterium paludicola]TFU34155.1 MSMEG_0568 family radical SAM protein [Microbacterium paludicola]
MTPAPTSTTDRVSTRVSIALLGVRSDAPVRRTGGAGPSDDGHFVIDGAGAAIPLNLASPYVVNARGRLTLDGADLGFDVSPVTRPRFYDLQTSEGVAYDKIAKLHGKNVLATTVVQTCVRYDESERCRFCAIEASLDAGTTIAVKTPAMLAEVAEAAVRLDGVTNMVMTTGTSNGWDRGAKHLARCVRAVKKAVPSLEIQVQCEPPADLQAITDLYEAGARSIGIHVESMDDAVRARWMPGKSRVSMDEYRASWREAVRVFGWNQVSTYLLVGLGEDPDELVAGAAELIEMGVYPFIVPFRPLKGTLATDVDRVPAPDRRILNSVTARVATLLQAAGMRGEDQRAGCAACGACSALQTAGA